MTTDTTDHLRIRPGSLPARKTFLRNPLTNDFRKDRYRWVGTVIVEWGGKKLQPLVLAESKADEDEAKATREWTGRLCVAATSAARRGSLSAFQENDVTFDLPKDMSAGDVEPVSVPLSAEYRSQLDSEYESDRLARRRFDEAVETLRESVSYGVSSDTESLLYFLQASVDAAYLGDMYEWYREKMGGIRSRLADLKRRKNRAHAGFRASAEYIRQQLYSFSTPVAWRSQPPTRDPLRRD